MATVNRGKDIDLLRQEGDDSDVVFTVPSEALVLTVNTTAIFQVKDIKNVIQFTKSSTINITGQIITIPFVPSDTKSKSGNHRWELQVTDASFGIKTIGGGMFRIRKELII
jgi:hypothetical protein